MIKINSPFKRKLVLAFFACLAILALVFSYHQYGFISLLFIAFSFVGLLVSAWPQSGDFKAYQQSKQFKSFLISIMGLVCLLGLLLLDIFLDRRLNAPTLIYAQYSDLEIPGLFLDLKEDGQYVLGYQSRTDEYFYYGSYEMKDSHVLLDRTPLPAMLQSKTLVFKASPVLPAIPLERPKLMKVNYTLLQVGSDGLPFNNSIALEVVEDKR